MTNVVVLRGRLSRTPGERLLPSGDRLTTFDLTMPPAPGDGRGRAESVGMSWFDAPKWVGGLEAGAELVVVGRVRRRFFQAGTGLQSRTEVVVDQAVPARHSARVATLLHRAAARCEQPPP